MCHDLNETHGKRTEKWRDRSNWPFCGCSSGFLNVFKLVKIFISSHQTLSFAVFSAQNIQKKTTSDWFRLSPRRNMLAPSIASPFALAPATQATASQRPFPSSPSTPIPTIALAMTATVAGHVARRSRRTVMLRATTRSPQSANVPKGCLLHSQWYIYIYDLQFGLCYISWRKSKALKLWMAGTVIQFKLGNNIYFFIPIVSMYGIFTYIFTYIYHTNGPNVGKYTIHGYYGIWIYLNVFSCCWSPGVDSCDLLGWSLVLVRLQQMQR